MTAAPKNNVCILYTVHQKLQCNNSHIFFKLASIEPTALFAKGKDDDILKRLADARATVFDSELYAAVMNSCDVLMTPVLKPFSRYYQKHKLWLMIMIFDLQTIA